MNSILRALYPATLGVALVAASSAFADDRVKGGNWEATMDSEGSVNKIVFCIDAAQATALNGDSKAGKDFAERKSGARCAVKSYETNGDTLSYTLSCGPRAITDVTHFHGETSDGVKTVTFEGKTITTRVKSKRLGPCP